MLLPYFTVKKTFYYKKTDDEDCFNRNYSQCINERKLLTNIFEKTRNGQITGMICYRLMRLFPRSKFGDAKMS